MVLFGEGFKKSELFDSNEYDPERTRPEGLKKLFTEVRQRLDAAAKRNEKTYNLRRHSEQFWPNQPVWRKNFVRSAQQNFTRQNWHRSMWDHFILRTEFRHRRTKRQLWE
ncbi:hypothetical protein JTB14_025487 [Gonioctena quinquepunctata]|nr:hypothetical protein JTB14_025487 [Gonioctena quinquepunctata]